ncbi:MAG: signal recognition particle-docking protein FtsY [Acidobacteria bacterium]|uniref:Signal recognition particle receptor FtsY n=1 Tax=Candidatus Polarisedimenticola svalbardensis TaxID=2886004 RepID=A0A8J6Y5R7_9BACT|nr:signal recognition particle-docking protein FtsY [Candidatus Polarisedimenticola svalbardensis]
MALGGIKKLFRGLTRTRESLTTSLQTLVGNRPVDEETLEDLEVDLLAADLGPTLTREVIDALRVQAKKGSLSTADLRPALKELLMADLRDGKQEDRVVRSDGRPHVVFVVGVNGSGKTTTIGKMAAREKGAGRSVMMVAADTFRAAAIDQLERWSERSGADFVSQREGADPASVVFDGLQAARARGTDLVLVDTAGRLHTKVNLMAELEKLTRVARKVIDDAPDEVLLVLDATTGQNGLNQAKNFTKAATLTGVVLTKLDGTAKGGVTLGIRRELGVPVRMVGVGEGLDDLLDFDAEAFVDGLLGTAQDPS